MRATPFRPNRRWPGTERGHSDAEIATRVTEMLTASPEVDASGLDVWVTNGVVTLVGPPRPGQEAAAERIARSVRGVSSVRFADPS